MGAALLFVLVSVPPAPANTLDVYVGLTAELTFVAWGCQLKVDLNAYNKMFPSMLQLGPKKREEVEKRIDDAMASLQERIKSKGDPAFCAEMIAKYGPSGTKHKSLVQPLAD